MQATDDVPGVAVGIDGGKWHAAVDDLEPRLKLQLKARGCFRKPDNCIMADHIAWLEGRRIARNADGKKGQDLTDAHDVRFVLRKVE